MKLKMRKSWSFINIIFNKSKEGFILSLIFIQDDEYISKFLKQFSEMFIKNIINFIIKSYDFRKETLLSLYSISS